MSCAPLIAATLAIVLTVTAPWWTRTVPTSVFADFTLSWGIIFAALPFGGLHNGPPWLVVAIAGPLLNGLLWAAAAAGLARLMRSNRAPR